MSPKEEKVDLRILRTRRLLVQAMKELLEEKDLQSITISDIAEQAMINRATFYAHFADKYDLFAYIVQEFFKGILEAEVSDTAEFNRDNLQKLAVSVINAVSQLHGSCTPGPRDQVQPMIEALIKLHADNLSNLTPHPWYVFMNYSHPPLLQRLRALKRIGNA